MTRACPRAGERLGVNSWSLRGRREVASRPHVPADEVLVCCFLSLPKKRRPLALAGEWKPWSRQGTGWPASNGDRLARVEW